MWTILRTNGPSGSPRRFCLNPPSFPMLESLRLMTSFGSFLTQQIAHLWPGSTRLRHRFSGSSPPQRVVLHVSSHWSSSCFVCEEHAIVLSKQSLKPSSTRNIASDSLSFPRTTIERFYYDFSAVISPIGS